MKTQGLIPTNRLFFAVVLLLSACQGLGPAFLSPAPTPTQTASALPQTGGEPVVSPQAAEPPGLATALPPGQGRRQSTPLAGQTPMIQVADQDVSNGSVKLDRVTSAGPGWVVIYSDGADGEPADVIGYAPVVDGFNTSVTVKIDAAKVTPRLHAVLHADTGQIGVFEFPTADPPVYAGVRLVKGVFMSNQMAMAAASPIPGLVEPVPATASPVETAAAMPMATGQPADMSVAVQVDSQPLRNGTVRISQINSQVAGWIGVHLTNPDGSLLPAAIGAAPVKPGINNNVIVKLTDPRRATKVMVAMLHIDAGEIGVYEFPKPAIDVPVLEHGMEVMQPFTITAGIMGQDVLINQSQEGETPHLTDAQGYSLYVLSTGSCDVECQKTWMPVWVTGKLVAGPGVTANKLGLIGITKDSRQVTYGNLPLYYYIGDNAPGETNGQGADGQWFLARP